MSAFELRLEESENVLLIERDGAVLCRVPLDSDLEECFPFRETRVWQGMAVVGIGHRLLFVAPDSGTVHSHDLGEYFSHLYEAEDCLLVAACSRVHRFDAPGSPTWSSPEVGLDGVIIESVADGCVLGSGEWDPPGGWQPFTLDLTTGCHIQPRH